VLAASGRRAFTAAGLAGHADGWFGSGTLTWTTGANAITLMEIPVRPIATGDAFDIFAGCDKTFETCRAKFANAANFRGFPHIPGQDTVVRYASQGDPNTGEVL